MKTKIIYAIEAIIILMIIFTIPSFASTAIVNTETLNLRKEASTDSNIIELLSQNDEIEIISEDGDWYKVKHEENIGYVKKEYIKLNENSESIVKPSESTSETSETTSNENKNSTETMPTAAQEDRAKTKSKVKVRLIPAINANIIESIEENVEIEIIAKTNKWAFIQYKEITGWIPLTNIEEAIKESMGEEQEPVKEESNEETTNNEGSTEYGNTIKYEKVVTKYINETSVYLRSEANINSSVVTTLIKNTDVKVVGEEGEWYKVTYNELSGYIRKDLLADSKVSEVTSRGDVDRSQTTTKIESTANTESSNTSLGQQIVEYAKQYLNCPYVYGAAGSSSFDCSGFTMYVYKHFGYSLSHSAIAQSKCGKYVSKENLEPGDLVFFLDYETMDGIGHCGIYIGDGNFIHASSGTGYCVKISTLTSGSYYNRYSTARRLY